MYHVVSSKHRFITKYGIACILAAQNRTHIKIILGFCTVFKRYANIVSIQYNDFPSRIMFMHTHETLNLNILHSS